MPEPPEEYPYYNEPPISPPDDEDSSHSGGQATQTYEGEPETGRDGARRPRRFQTFAALGYKDFRYLWFGQIAHASALHIEMIARPWLVLSLTDDVYHLGLVLLARSIPQFAIGLVAGVMADWYDRRSMLLVAKNGSAFANGALALLVLSGNVELWHLYVTAIIRGLFTALDQPARESMIPSLVPRERLTNAVALNSATMNVMRIAGGVIGGFLLAFAGIGWTFMIIAGMFFGAVFLTTLLPSKPRPKVVEKNLRAGVASFKEGISYAWATPSIRWVVTLAMVFFTFGMAYMQVFAPLFARDVLDIGARGLGFLMSAAGVGAVIAALTLATVSPQRHRGKILIAIAIMFSCALILFSLSTYLPWIALSFFFMAFVGMGQTGSFSLNKSILLDNAPDELRGRVISLLNLDRSMSTLGATMAGFAAAAFGVQSAQILFGAACLAGVILIAMLAPALRKIA